MMAGDLGEGKSLEEPLEEINRSKHFRDMLWHSTLSAGEGASEGWDPIPFPCVAATPRPHSRPPGGAEPTSKASKKTQLNAGHN